jgi:hypothetical protein
MQKLNCKTNAAGWVPSSGNRTAQAFSQPGKGVPHIVGGTVRLASNQLTGLSASANKQNKSSQMYVSSRNFKYYICKNLQLGRVQVNKVHIITPLLI